MSEYIYILEFLEEELDEAWKIGSTKYPKNRLNTYQTGKYKNWNFTKIFQVEHRYLN